MDMKRALAAAAASLLLASGAGAKVQPPQSGMVSPDSTAVIGNHLKRTLGDGFGVLDEYVMCNYGIVPPDSPKRIDRVTVVPNSPATERARQTCRKHGVEPR